MKLIRLRTAVAALGLAGSMLGLAAAIPAHAASRSAAVTSTGIRSTRTTTATPAAKASIMMPTPAVESTAASAPLYEYCSPVDQAYCWTEHSDSPFYVFLNTSRGSSELYYWLDTGECNGGHVTSTCPFADPRMDKAIVGHDITTFQFYNSGLCMAALSSDYMDSATCSSGTNEAFVPVANGSIFVSVGGSNYAYVHAGEKYPADDQELCTDFTANGYNEPLLWFTADKCNSGAYGTFVQKKV